MTAWRRVIELSIGDAEVAKLTSIARSRCGERSRADKVREHDGELAAFSVVAPSWLSCHGRRRCRNGNRSAAEIADRPQHPPAMT